MSGKPGLAARQAAATVLARIVDDGRGLDGLLETRHGPAAVQALNESERGLVRAIATTACRHRGEVERVLKKLMNRPPPAKARHLVNTLHVAAAQILFMDVPDRAAVDLAVTALKADKRSTRFAALGNAVLRRMSAEGRALLDALDAADRARANMPDWLFRRLRSGYGKDRATQIAQAHMHEPVLDITVKADPAHWAEQLGGVEVFGNSIRVARDGDVASWPGYEEGAWWVQDAAATLPASLLGDVVGKRVADLCAAPGGKTAQLAAAGAHIAAVDMVASRLKRLKQNLDRLQLEAEIVEADLLTWKPDVPFDAILLDAPCSSTGTIRRHPDVQWAKTAEGVDELAVLQKQMLERAAGFLKPGGTLVFANCSIDRAEGEDIVASLDTRSLGLRLSPVTADEVYGHDTFLTRQGTVRTLPHFLPDLLPTGSKATFGGLDGFFAARFVRD